MGAATFKWGVVGETSYRSIVESTARLNIWHGAVRAGKTVDSIVRWIAYVATDEVAGELLMIGKTERTLKRNILDVIESMVGSANFQINIGQGEARLFGRRVYLVGASDARSEGKIRGMTLAGAYGDEATLWPEDFFVMLLSRLSVEGAKLFVTTNPAGPKHWLYDGYIKNDGLDLRHWQYRIDDNLNLPAKYIEQLKAEYTGVWRRRYILGEWCVAEGLVYPMFDEARHVCREYPKIARIAFAVDVGHSNATVFLAIGEGVDRRAYVLREYYHSGRKAGATKSPIQYAKDFVRFKEDIMRAHEGADFDGIYIDPSALGFRMELRELDEYRTYEASNGVVDGIQTVASVIDADLLRVHASCVNTLDELGGYAWDDKAAARGEDRPVKENDHAMDALRYYFQTNRRDWIGRRLIEVV